MFTLSEFSIANKLLDSIYETLSSLHKIVKDRQPLSEDNYDLMLGICENQVPFRWRQIWSGPKLLVEYLKAAVQRGVTAKQRFESTSETFEQNVDFSQIFSVETFLSALKLKNARELNVSACDLNLCTSLQNTSLSTQTTRIKVASLYVS